MKKVLLLLVVATFLFGCVYGRVIDCNRYIDPKDRAACQKGLEELKAEQEAAEEQAAYNYGRGRGVVVVPYSGYYYPYGYSYPYGYRSPYGYSYPYGYRPGYQYHKKKR